MKKLLISFLIISSLSVFSQNEPKKKDLKVGLVLSGGGAKGFAHVAAIKVLEEAGVRIDYVGGTSMGAIVGGLYAAGYNGTQLDSILRAIDYQQILSRSLPRKSKPFYEKENGEKYILVLPIKKGKVGIPVALTGGQNLLNLLTRLTQQVNNTHDFNKLPTPFLCIATNLENGKQEVLRNGFLPLAIKASGSFPTLLSPVEINGKLLTDGGIINNFPAKEVKEMGADIVIGVDTQSGLDKKENLDSAVKILNQIVSFQISKNGEGKNKYVDVLIKPTVQKYNVVSFDKIDEIMKQGDSAARIKMADLKAIAKQQIKIEKPQIKNNYKQKFVIKKIEITGNKNYTRAYMLGKLNIRRKDSTNYDKLESCINNIAATGNFESVQYNMLQSDEGETIQFKVKENEISNYLKLGIHYDDLYKTGVLVNYTSKHVLSKNDVLSADFILGDNLRYNLNYFIDNGFYWSFGIRSRYNTFHADVNFNEANVNKISLSYEDITNQIYVQTVFNRKFALEIGAEQKNIKAYTETIGTLDSIPSNASRLYFDKSDYFNLIASIKIDTYDKKYFQKKGFYLNTDFKWFLTSSNYNKNFKAFTQIKGKMGLAFTIFNKLTTHFVSEAGITIGDNDNRVLDFNIGGYGENFINEFILFYGYDFAQLSANSFLRSALTFRYEFLPKNYLITTANYARVEKDVFNEGRIFENTKSGYMVGYGLDTFLGPIEINYSWSPDHNETYWYFNVGYWF
ncbi:MAG: patatin-like phospholipase family protein [Lutibacter sp.]|uniref:patatin-like phospholipase family protein n=1 Tax=Lutibacter sp. TaxID=1925666 RepID=UPI003859B7E4